MPTGLEIGYGLISGALGAAILGMIMMLMGDKMKPSAPGIIAEKFLGSADKGPMIMMPVLAIWGLVYTFAMNSLPAGIVGGIVIGIVAWLVLGLIMLPMSGGGLFGMKAKPMLPVMALMMHIIWGALLWVFFQKVFIDIVSGGTV